MAAESSIGNNLQGESNKTAPGAIPAGGRYESQDRKSRVKLVRSDRAGMEKGPGGSYLGDNSRPVLIVGFPGVGLVGSISANYIIEKKNMHQIAFVDSEYVVPSAIYIGGKLRHPFRIYADSERTLCVIVCEAPLMPQGVHSIMGLLVEWASKNHVKEVLVLDGVPVKGLPAKHREPLILSSSNSSNPPTKEGTMGSAMMVGLSGGLISACISDDMPCTGVLIHSTSGVPDPEGAAILLDTISQMPSVPLEIDTEPLRMQGQEIKRQLKAFIDSVQREQGAEGRGRYLKSSRIYG